MFHQQAVTQYIGLPWILTTQRDEHTCTVLLIKTNKEFKSIPLCSVSSYILLEAETLTGDVRATEAGESPEPQSALTWRHECTGLTEKPCRKAARIQVPSHSHGSHSSQAGHGSHSSHVGHTSHTGRASHASHPGTWQSFLALHFPHDGAVPHNTHMPRQHLPFPQGRRSPVSHADL